MSNHNRIEYFIFAKRKSRDNIPDHWHERISEIEGVAILNASKYSAKIIATPRAAEQVRKKLNEFFHVEKKIERHTL